MSEQDPRSPGPPLSLGARMVGVITSPRETFTSVVAHPRWLDVLIVTTLVTALAYFVILSTDVGQQAQVEQQVAGMESWGQEVTDEAYANLQASAPIMRYFAAGSILIIGPLMTFLIAGVLFLVFAAMMGGAGTYRQVLAIVSHGGVITGVVYALFVTPLNYVRESMTSATTLSVFLPMVPADSFFGRLLGMIDVFWLWWMAVIGIGLSVLFRRASGPIVAALYAAFFIIIIGIAAVMTLVSR